MQWVQHSHENCMVIHLLHGCYLLYLSTVPQAFIHNTLMIVHTKHSPVVCGGCSKYYLVMQPYNSLLWWDCYVLVHNGNGYLYPSIAAAESVCSDANLNLPAAAKAARASSSGRCARTWRMPVGRRGRAPSTRDRGTGASIVGTRSACPWEWREKRSR